MRVQALASFAGVTPSGTMTIRRGAEFDLPAGVDWLAAGLVAPVATPAPHLADVERAVDPAPLTAERRTRKRRTG